MEIHLYALCWDELDIFPFFFRHYDRFVTQYYIFDNGSTDGSVEFLRSHPNVELRRFVPSDRDSFVLSEQSLSDECWKGSRGVADWVIVTDVDEHLYHPRIIDLLRDYKALGISIVPALGYEMISEEFPRPDETLCETRTRGAPTGWYSKASIFDPSAISDICYGLGRHWASPAGDVIVPPRDELRLLHYKHIGYERTRRRCQQLRGGLGTKDLENRWDARYSRSDVEFAHEWRELSEAAIDVHSGLALFDFPNPPWWEPLRLPAPQGDDTRRSKIRRPLGAETAKTRSGPALVSREIRKLVATFPDVFSQLAPLAEQPRENANGGVASDDKLGGG